MHRKLYTGLVEVILKVCLLFVGTRATQNIGGYGSDLSQPCTGSGHRLSQIVTSSSNSCGLDRMHILTSPLMYTIHKLMEDHEDLLGADMVSSLANARVPGITRFNWNGNGDAAFRNDENTKKSLYDALLLYTVGVQHIAENWRYWAGLHDSSPVSRAELDARQDSIRVMVNARSLLCCMRQYMDNEGVQVNNERARMLGQQSHPAPSSHLSADRAAYILLNNFKSDFLPFLRAYIQRSTGTQYQEYTLDE